MGELGNLMRMFVTQALVRQGLDLRLVFDSGLVLWSVTAVVGDVTVVKTDESLTSAMERALREVQDL